MEQTKKGGCREGSNEEGFTEQRENYIMTEDNIKLKNYSRLGDRI